MENERARRDPGLYGAVIRFRHCHTISTRTVGQTGLINQTWVNQYPGEDGNPTRSANYRSDYGPAHTQYNGNSNAPGNYRSTTTPPYTGPTGQVYISTIPQGAAITLDGIPSDAVTPILLSVPVGKHVVLLKLAGYNEAEANFEVKNGVMTTVSQRLSPGSSVIPIKPVTTAVTTVPVTTVTRFTPAPTVAPVIIPTSQGNGFIQIPSWASRFIGFFSFKW